MHCIIALSMGLQFMSRKGDGWETMCFEWSNELMGWGGFLVKTSWVYCTGIQGVDCPADVYLESQ
jgi:hypothetical protein